MRCPCGKEFDLGPGKGHNRLFNKHCSRYCKIYFDNPDKWIKPKIEVGCEACENTLLLAPYEKEGNKQFCSKSCWKGVVQSHKGQTNWTVLKIVQLYGPISAKGIAERYCTNNTVMTSRTAANILKLFRARGIVEQILAPI